MKTLLLTQEANSDLEDLQERIQSVQTITKAEIEQIQKLINRCKMFANQAEIVLTKVEAK